MQHPKNDSIIDLLASQSDMRIATLSSDGHPSATTFSYVHDAMVLYFGTSSLSLKAQNISKDGRVSLTVNRPYRFWKDIEGLSIKANAANVDTQEESQEVSQLLFERFPEVYDFVLTNFVLTNTEELNYHTRIGRFENFNMQS